MNRNTILRVVQIQFKAVPWHCTLSILMGTAVALMMAVNVIATQALFDTIVDAALGQADFWACLVSLIVLAGVTFGIVLMQGIMNFQTGVVLFGKSTGKITNLLQRKLQHIDPMLFEDTEFLDDLNKAREGGMAIPYFTIILFFLISLYLIYFASIGFYLFNLQPMLLVTLALSFLPALFAQVVRIKIFTELENQSAPLRREYEYYQSAICSREYLKETRILGAFKFFHQLFDETMQLFIKKQWQAERKTALLQLLLNISTFAGMAIASWLLFSAAMAGDISVGTFAAVFGALGTLFGMMQEIVTMHIGNLNREIGKIVNFIRLLDRPERNGVCGETDFTKGIVMENVSFTYQGREHAVVKNVSLRIAEGETIAIVGENGAGKSTLVRLLTGIYRPNKGKVTIGGLDSAVTNQASLYRRISGVFQNYQRYKMTMGDNIAISDTRVQPDTAKIEATLNMAGAKRENTNIGTMLSPEFDGIDLSGGQWQRLAIARGLYRVNEFIVLDEPTAAIDPLEEQEIYKQFQQLATHKCAIIVTHRLGSVKLAHRIVVMEDGNIIDIGTHDELLSRQGKYADMWEAQSQ